MIDRERSGLRGWVAWLLAVAPLLTGCADLAMEPDRVPASITLEPADTLITQGDEAFYRVTVLDQDGEPFPSYPSWAPPEWLLSDPDAVAVAPNGRVDALGGGEVRVEATLVGFTARANLRVNPRTVKLSAPIIYLIQSTQNLVGDVPLVAGRDALLRVFATGDRASFYQPLGRASLYLNGEEVYATPLFPGSYLIPQMVDESRLDRSFNAVIPGTVLQPGVEIVVKLDVDGVVPLAPGSQVRIPTEGSMPLDVRAMPRMDLTVVPVLVAAEPNSQVYAWTGSLTADGPTLRFVRLLLPIGDMDLEVRETYTTSADLTTGPGWGAFLREISVLRVTDGSDRYYYGATMLPRGSRWGGMGYVGSPVSVGAAKAGTLAHELGHNMSLKHAPCGSVTSWDRNFPHDGGSTGVWGYNFAGGSGLGALVDPNQYKDFMGYCKPRWISDYHFKKALTFRMEHESMPAPDSPQPTQRQSLLLWGAAGDGELLLEPAFIVAAAPALPSEDGPYRLEGYDVQGRRRFALSFTPEEVSRGGGQFAFAVPVEADWAESLDAITLSGPEGVITVDRSTRLGRMALVTDGTSGRIRAILRDGPIPAPLGVNAEVTFSEGLPNGPAPWGRE